MPQRSETDPGAAVGPGSGGGGGKGDGKGGGTKLLSRPSFWVASTYFAEGYPYSVVHYVGDVLFKEMGASLQQIGLTALFHLPWNLKFLWGPFLDAYATKRRWLIWTEVALSALIVALAFATTADRVLGVAAVVFVAMAFLSATHDIAIDGYYLEGLDRDGQSRYVGFRVMAYRLAMLTVSGPIIMLIGVAGWLVGLAVTAAIMIGLLAYHVTSLPRVETPKRPIGDLIRSSFRLPSLGIAIGLVLVILGARELMASAMWASAWVAIGEIAPAVAKISTSGWIGLVLIGTLLGVLAMLGPIRRRISRSDSFYSRALVDFLEQRHVGRILAFVVLFRTGESFLLKMRYPFLRDIGMTTEQYGLANGTFGLIASIIATMLGGWLISKHGLRRWIWPFVLMQNLLNLAYAALAHHADGLGAAGRPGMVLLTSVICVEAVGSGLGTAVFMVYLMRCCRPRFKAAHMAIVTALMSVSFTFAGVASGFLAESLGYARFFAFSFVAAVPGMLLIPFIPYMDGTSAADPDPPREAEPT